MPSTEAVAEHYRMIADLYQFGQGIHQYLEAPDHDPHLFYGLANLRECVKKAHFDPQISYSTTDAIKPQYLIALGTGDGQELEQLILRYQPCYLIIAVQEWEDFATSFWSIDWKHLSSLYHADPRKELVIGRYTSATDLLSALYEISLASIDHALIYVPPSASDQTRQIQKELTEKLVTNSIGYLGFTLDEYNMVWHAWRSLQNSPKIFSQPRLPVGGLYVICGSGPSLDAALPLLHRLATSHQVIACASNYRSLRAAGIEVDLLVLLERGSFMVDDYREIVHRYGVGKTRLLASVTCPAPLQELFCESAVYFRPALTPLAVFADSPREILYFEGPQTINTGVALAASLQASQIVLVGVDLGMRQGSHPRSQAAAGQSPRDFTLEKPANFGGTVLTDRYLLDGQLSLEMCLRSHPKMKVWNASDGLAIAGAEPITLFDYSERYGSLDGDGGRESFNKWWDGLRQYNPNRFQASWRSRRPRQAISSLFLALRSLYSGSTPWFPDLQKESTRLLSLSVAPADQFPRRIVRGTLHKLTLAITRQLQVMGRDESAQAEFERESRRVIVELLDYLEAECYQLCDQLDSSC